MSTIKKFTGSEFSFDWENVKSKDYPDGRAKGASGKVMIHPDDGAPYFLFRYFRIEPSGHSTLEDYHAHDHGVMILHGRASVDIEGEKTEVGPKDIVYISPFEKHSLTCLGDEPLGFLCVIANKDMLAKLKVTEE